MATYINLGNGEECTFLPYGELSAEQRKMVDSDDYHIRADAARNRWGLDKLLHDPSWYVRDALAEVGYGLGILVDDSSELVRAQVAAQGYGLDSLLLEDDESMIYVTAANVLRNEGVTLEQWRADHPDRCAMPKNKERYRNRIACAMSAAGLEYDELESSELAVHFFGDGWNPWFDDWKSCEMWLRGVVFDDPATAERVYSILDAPEPSLRVEDAGAAMAAALDRIKAEEDGIAYAAFILAYDLLHDRIANSSCDTWDYAYPVCRELAAQFMASEECANMRLSFGDALVQWVDRNEDAIYRAIVTHGVREPWDDCSLASAREARNAHQKADKASDAIRQ